MTDTDLDFSAEEWQLVNNNEKQSVDPDLYFSAEECNSPLVNDNCSEVDREILVDSSIAAACNRELIRSLNAENGNRYHTTYVEAQATLALLAGGIRNSDCLYEYLLVVDEIGSGFSCDSHAALLDMLRFARFTMRIPITIVYVLKQRELCDRDADYCATNLRGKTLFSLLDSDENKSNGTKKAVRVRWIPVLAPTASLDDIVERCLKIVRDRDDVGIYPIEAPLPQRYTFKVAVCAAVGLGYAGGVHVVDLLRQGRVATPQEALGMCARACGNLFTRMTASCSATDEN